MPLPKSPLPFSVCVYCGARPGRDPAYSEAARATALQAAALLGLPAF